METKESPMIQEGDHGARSQEVSFEESFLICFSFSPANEKVDLYITKLVRYVNGKNHPLNFFQGQREGSEVWSHLRLAVNIIIGESPGFRPSVSNDDQAGESR